MSVEDVMALALIKEVVEALAGLRLGLASIAVFDCGGSAV